MNLRSRVSGILVMLMAAACSRSVSVELPAQPLTVVQYSQGHATQRCTISPGTHKYQELADFLRQHANRWHKRSADYEPSLVVIGADINMYFMDDLLVLNYAGGEYAREVSSGSYGFLGCGNK